MAKDDGKTLEERVEELEDEVRAIIKVVQTQEKQIAILYAHVGLPYKDSGAATLGC